MRTHFPGALHEVRSAARFPLSAAGAWMPGECVAYLTNSKEDEQMEKRTQQRQRRLSPNQGSKILTEAKCPVAHGARRHTVAGPDECGLVAESAEPEDSAPELPPVRSDGKGVQLC